MGAVDGALVRRSSNVSLRAPMSASVAIVFAVSCVQPCVVSERSLVEVERAAASVLSDRGFSVRPPPKGVPRPTSPEADSDQPLADLPSDRIVVLDLEPSAQVLWLTHYVRGVSGPWGVDKIPCTVVERKLKCPRLRSAVQSGLRPRKVHDVDFAAALRSHAKSVGRCVLAEDQVPAAERIFGRVELDVLVTSDGRAEVSAIAPARVARSPFGSCLRVAFADMNVGPFEGLPVTLRIPIDL